MFERTFSFWQKWIGGANEPKPADHDDRRNWIRYPSDLQTSVQLADAPAEMKQPARVRNISRGGASLVVDRAFKAGQMLSIELNRADEESVEIVHLLACIVHAQPEPSGKHALGCVFSRELSDHDLEGFGARRLRHSPEDNRTWRRFDCKLTANFSKVGDPASRLIHATVSNISASGVGLEVTEEVPAGALLNLEVIGEAGRAHRPILTCVVHVAKKAENLWSLGCNFIRELSEAEFQEMM